MDLSHSNTDLIVRDAPQALGVNANFDEEEGDATVEDELCAADMLTEMAQGLHDRLPQFPPDGGASADIRPEVLRMLEHYLEGQRDILQSLVAFAQEKEAHRKKLSSPSGEYMLSSVPQQKYMPVSSQ